jgi:hypothetical protein
VNDTPPSDDFLLGQVNDLRTEVDKLSIKVATLESKSTSQSPVSSFPVHEYVRPVEIVSAAPQQQQQDSFFRKLARMFGRGGSYHKGMKISRRYKRKGGTQNKRNQKARTRRIR